MTFFKEVLYGPEKNPLDSGGDPDQAELPWRRFGFSECRLGEFYLFQLYFCQILF